jgi:2-keto-3-deoxy-L-rhamnonate aldolase RhmA
VPVDHGSDGVFTLETPGAIAEHDRVLLLVGVGAIFLGPCFALGEAIRRQRRIGLDQLQQRAREILNDRKYGRARKLLSAMTMPGGYYRTLGPAFRASPNSFVGYAASPL